MSARDFDPVRLAQAEYEAWVGYYRRDWRGVLLGAVRMVRLGFGMSWPRTLRGAWYVLRANQAWAPYPGNNPERARALMRRFYALVVRDGQLRLEPGRAAQLEVEWWRIHRERQREDHASEEELVHALVDLYTYVYDADRESMREAAQQRVVAMRHSDDWVAGGCRMDDPLLEQERAALTASYTALLAAVRR